MTNIVISVFLSALALIESDNDAHKVGKHSEVGVYQIRKACVRDVNKIWHTHFTQADCVDTQKAKAVCLLYLTHYGDQYRAETGLAPSVTVLARIWNGGPRGWKRQSTADYAQRLYAVYLDRLVSGNFARVWAAVCQIKSS